jgi:hypothetical protein
MRQMTRRTSHSFRRVLVSSPNTSAHFARSSFTAIRQSAATRFLDVQVPASLLDSWGLGNRWPQWTLSTVSSETSRPAGPEFWGRSPFSSDENGTVPRAMRRIVAGKCRSGMESQEPHRPEGRLPRRHVVRRQRGRIVEGSHGTSPCGVVHSLASLGGRHAVWRDRMVNGLYLLTYAMRGRSD